MERVAIRNGKCSHQEIRDETIKNVKMKPSGMQKNKPQGIGLSTSIMEVQAPVGNLAPGRKTIPKTRPKRFNAVNIIPIAKFQSNGLLAESFLSLHSAW